MKPTAEELYLSLTNTLQSYIRSSKESNYSTLRSLLHPDARIYYSDSLESRKLLDHWGKIPAHIQNADPEQLKLNTKLTINSIFVEELIAHVSLSVETMFHYKYVDFHTLIWVEDRWLFVSKVSHLISSPSTPKTESIGEETALDE